MALQVGPHGSTGKTTRHMVMQVGPHGSANRTGTRISNPNVL